MYLLADYNKVLFSVLCYHDAKLLHKCRICGKVIVLLGFQICDYVRTFELDAETKVTK